MNELIYLVLATKECENINSVIPSKYRGVLTPSKDPFQLSLQRNVYSYTKKWLHTYDGKTADVCEYHWEAEMVYAYELLGKLKSPKNFKTYEYVYIFENLTDAEMSLIRLSIDSEKIFTSEFLGGAVLPSMLENLLTVMRIMEDANTTHYNLKRLYSDSDFLFDNIEFSECVQKNISMLNPLRLNKKMLNIYEKQFEKFFHLRHVRIADTLWKRS